MKRVLPLFLAICIILSYHYDVEAASLSQFVIRCQSTVPSDQQGGLPGVLYGSVFPDSGADGVTLRQNVIDGLATFDFSVLEDYDYYIVQCYTSGDSSNPSSANVTVTYFNSDVQPYYVSDNTYSSRASNYIYAQLNGSFYYQTIYVTTSGYGEFGSLSSGTFSSIYLDGASDYGYGNGSSDYYVLDTNFPVLAAFEAAQKSGIEYASWSDSRVKAWAVAGGFSECTNIFENTEGYDAQGNIVSGNSPEPEIESNENHMYFKDCDLGFCIPKNMTNFNSFGGAYVYCRYVVDDWVVNHISDYKVVVSMNSIVGGRQFGSSVTLPLDRDGCVTIPFNAFSTNEIVGFTTYINKTLIEQDFYKTFLYSLSNQQLQVMYQKKSFSQGWTDFVTGGSSNPLIAVVSPSNTEIISGLNDIATAATQRFDPYKIRLQCYLIDNSENRSGTVARLFDLVTGNDDAVDNSGMTNDNPFEPDVTDPDYTPTVPGDNSTYPQIIINNGGSWTGNLNGVIGFDPGYRQLKEDIDADPDGNFTQYLAPFENNDAGGFIMGFINGMPSAMKTIFISGFGVLTLLGIYRFIRRG